MDRLIYGTRINSRWCFVVNDAAHLATGEGDVTAMDAACPCGENAMRLVALVPSDLTRWVMRCTRCGTCYPVAQMPARQCAPGAWQVDAATALDTCAYCPAPIAPELAALCSYHASICIACASGRHDGCTVTDCACRACRAITAGWMRTDCQKRHCCARCGNWPQWGWWRDGVILCNACHGDPPEALTRYDALPPTWAIDLDERDANARYGLGG